MLQRKSFVILLLCSIFTGCSDPASPPSSQPATSNAASSNAAGTIVSLSPAATDLLLAMGAADRLVGVSTYDNDPRIAALPKVGDYENVDWERIATLAPKHMIVQMAADRVPPGFRERAEKLGIDIHVVQIDRLNDVIRQIIYLGMMVSPSEAIDLSRSMKSTAGSKQLQRTIEAQLAEAHRRAGSGSPVRTLICVSENGLGVAGRGTYLDDLLIAAGGENVLDASRGTYAQLDRESLLALSPDAIIQLAPSPTTTQRDAMKAAWVGLGELQAVKSGRVLVIDEPWALMPGAHVGELAERMAKFLHP